MKKLVSPIPKNICLASKALYFPFGREAEVESLAEVSGRKVRKRGERSRITCDQAFLWGRMPYECFPSLVSTKIVSTSLRCK